MTHLQEASVAHLEIAGLVFSDWKHIRWTNGCERFPSDFDAEVSFRAGMPLLAPGDAFRLFVGKPGEHLFLVMTGWIDAVSNRISANDHTISLRGRSRCADLVDCSAEFPPDESQPSGAPKLVHNYKTVIQIAAELGAVYEPPILVSTIGREDAEEPGTFVIPQFDVNLGETAYQVIEKLARNQNLLVMDAPDGHLRLVEPTIPATLKDHENQSRLELGKNILAMSLELDFSQRYSEINVFNQTVNSQGEFGLDNNIFGTSEDRGITRHRRYMGFAETPYVLTQGSQPSQSWSQRRADWECNRRYGRSQVAHITVDAWTDASGTLWAPNTTVDVIADYAGFNATGDKAWVIAEVTFSQNEQSGTTAQLTLMPSLAFSIEPTAVSRLDGGIFAGHDPTGGAPT